MSFSSNQKWRYGYTTGACAAAASKAALLFLVRGWQGEKVEIVCPGGDFLQIPVTRASGQGDRATASVVKDAGDDPDVTNGLTVCSTVELLNGRSGITITAGRGVGVVTKPGLAVPVGEPAINPVPQEMINEAVESLLPPGKGLKITIKVPGGEEVASRTLNPRLGIKGGISILGTTGIVRPMSRDAYIESLTPQVTQALALGYKDLILTPGGKGAKLAQAWGIPLEQVIQTSNFIGALLDACAREGAEGVLFFGHLGKLAKVAAGIFQTHSSIADGRRETLAAHAALVGAPRDLIAQIMQLNTLEQSVPLFRREGLGRVYNSLAEAASERSRERVGFKMKVGTVLYDLSGNILGWDREAERIREKIPWRKQ